MTQANELREQYELLRDLLRAEAKNQRLEAERLELVKSINDLIACWRGRGNTISAFELEALAAALVDPPSETVGHKETQE